MKNDFNWGYREAAKTMGKASGGPVHVRAYARGGAVKKAAPVTPVKAVHKHESNMHKGKTPTKFSGGGSVKSSKGKC